MKERKMEGYEMSEETRDGYTICDNKHLKPCPFCGETPKRHVRNDVLSVTCENCVSIGFHNHIRLGCLADEEWNTRI